MPEETPRHILIHGPSWIGDLVMATPALRDIRAKYPDSRITLLVKPGRDRVLSGLPYFDEILIDRSAGSVRRVLGLARDLRRRRFDLTILFADSVRSRLIARLAGIPERVGYARNLGKWLLTQRVRYPGPGGAKVAEPMPPRFSRLIAAANVPTQDHVVHLAVPAEVEERYRERRRRLGVGPNEKLLGLNPGASFGASKVWPPGHFARLADRMCEKHGVRAMIFVGPGEERIARAIEDAMRYRPISTAEDLVPLDELKSWIRDLCLLVSTDTGPRQYAVAFGVPVVVLMGPTDPRYSGINLERSVVLRRDLPCSPCHLKVCPIDHRCMRGIEPDEVLEKIDELDGRLGIFGG